MLLPSRLDDSVLEHILSKLHPSALARAQLVCQHWSALITRAELWKQHVLVGSPHGSGSSNRSTTSSTPQALQPWRELCLHRAASSKWCSSGRLAMSATLNGHTGPVTCMDVLDTLVITGSSDGTARVWDLEASSQLHTLHMPAREALVAVGLPSANLAVTATARGGAVLWRAGRAIRRFDPLPGGRVSSLALTDTQLLLGSTSGAVQHSDLFSGQQQLITRHSSGVACLRTYRRRQQQQQQQGLEQAEEWVTLVGCVDGQVSCSSSATGRLLWQLPTRHPSKVVSMQLVEWQPHSSYTQQVQQQQQQQQHQKHKQCHKGKQRQQEAEQQQQQAHCGSRHVLLYVLNARSQLICWQLPAATLLAPGSALQAAASPLSPPAAGAGVSQVRMPSWPLSVCSVAAPVPQQQQQQQQDEGQQGDPQQQQQQGTRLRLQAAHNSSTCLLSPLFGRDCVLIGSSLGFITVAQLQQAGAAAAAAAAAAAGDGAAGASPATPAAAATSAITCAVPTNGNAAAVAAAEPPCVSAAAGLLVARVPSQAAAHASPAVAGSAAAPAQPQQQQQQSKHVHSAHGASGLELRVVRHCPLLKLGKVLAARQAASITAHRRGAASSSSSTSLRPAAGPPAAAGSAQGLVSGRSLQAAGAGVGRSVTPESEGDGAIARAEEHLLGGSDVLCMQWGPGGQVLVGLGSGHVACLKFKHAPASVWA